MTTARDRIEKALEDIKERRRCNYTWLGSPPFMNQIRVLEDVDFLLNLLAELQANLEKAKAALKFYANPNNHAYGGSSSTNVEDDEGSIARGCLAEIGGSDWT